MEPIQIPVSHPKISLPFAIFLICIILAGIASSIMIFLKPPVEQTAVVSTSETVGWKTYQSSQYGYELMYPSSWNYRVYEETLTLGSTTTPASLEGDPGNEIGVMIFSLGSSTDLHDWIQKRYEGEGGMDPIGYYTSPNGITFFKIQGVPAEDSDNMVAYALFGSEIIEISVVPASRYETVFNGVLSTFKFIK